jgi:hypothetical protein
MGMGISKKLAVTYIIVVMVCACLMSGVTIFAQVSGATLSGTVTDASGSAVPNATVSIKNTDTGIARDITTDAAGFYSVPNLPPAAYEVKTTASGFSTHTQTGITLTVGAQQTLNISLQVGQVSENVTVTGEAPQVELTSSALSGEVDETTVRELPLNGRDWSSLSVLEPGVVGIRTQQTTTGTVNRGNRGFGNQLSVAGHRPTENNYRVNGITVNDYSNGSPGSVQGSQLGVDAIQEFSVLTANYTAEYGRTSGGVINAITKAGTNNFHGDAYWFLRDEGLDTRNAFDPSGAGTPPFHRNQFGGSAGGPIQKGKTFIFGDFEAIRQTKDLSGNSTVPSAAARGNPGPNGTPTTVAVVNGSPLPASGPGAALDPDPISHISLAVEPYLKLYPLPNNGLNPGGDTGQFLAGIPITFSENYATARVDHHFSDKDDFDAVWFFDRGPQFAPDNLLLSTTETFSERIMGGLEWTHIFGPSLVNTARVGYNRTVGFVGKPGKALNPLAADTSLSDGFLPGNPAPILTGTGLTTMQGTLGDQTANDHYANSYQFYDDAFYTHGNHAFKFGFSVERIQYNELSVQRPNGTFTFQGSLDSLLINKPSSFQQGDSAIGKELGTRTTFFAGYIQDNWKIRPNLTLNLGLRYEIATLPTDSNGPFAVVPSPNISAAPINVAHPWQTNPTKKDFEPRIGFAWDPFKDGKSSVRGGFGIFDILPGPWVTNIQESGSYPFALTPAVGNLAQGDFPNVPGLNPATAIPSAQAYAPDQNPRRNYAMNWNLTIQRQITPTLTATIGYVGSHTLHSPFTTDTSNSVGPPQVITTPLGLLWPCGPDGTVADGCAVGFLPSGTEGAPSPSTVFNSHVGQLRPTFWDDAAHYNGLEAHLTKNFSHGLQGEASFTWSRCFDHGSSGDIGDAYQNSYSSLIFFNPGSRNGPCDFDVNKNFVGNLIYDIPIPKSSSSVVSHLAGGWEVGGILSVSTGTPFTLSLGGDPIGIKNGDSATYPDRISGCNPINSNWRTTLQYVNLSCFAAPYAPASMASQCATNSYPGASLAQLPSGMIYCQNLFGNSGRNSLVGPGLTNLDFMVFKNNYVRRISESFNVQFRAEFFNILNHPNYLPPIDNETIFSSSGALASGTPGKLDTTGGFESRQIQLSLKVIW